METQDIDAVKNGFVGVIFWTLDRCGGCVNAKPQFLELMSSFKEQVTFCIANGTAVDDAPTEFPSFDIWRRGKILARQIGFSAPDLRGLVEKALRPILFPLTDLIIVADFQPKLEHFKPIAEATQAKSLFNLRDSSEVGFISTEKEAAEAGIEHYEELPLLDVSDMTVKYLKKARNALKRLSKHGKILIHCHTGLTASIVACAFVAKESNGSMEEMAKWAAAIGPYNVYSNSRVEEVLKQYLSKKDDKAKKKKKKKKDKKK